ncbi:MAG: ABC-F family ATP-binding cassette domain-containing protein, partial [Planctomycetes bacterium]|nr:ABC-F family ATP-binding cassette domain-containing protein [Planctomycetota bacterium]
MITVRDLEMRYGPKLLFQNVNLQLMPECRYGLVGANGSGKSTFLKILSEEEQAGGGEVQMPSRCKLGVLNQDQFQYENETLINTVLMGRPELHELQKRIYELLEKDNFSEAESIEYAEVEARLGEIGGYSAESEAARLLEGLGLDEKTQSNPMHTLSGGYKLRVLLAQVLFSEPDILLLDEPTNHLDLYSIRWLESYLKKYRGTLVVISHDRDFINNLSTHILDVDYGSISCTKGNYDHYLKVFAEESVLREATLAKAEKKKDDLQDFVDRFRAKASKARQAQSKARMIEKLQAEMSENAAMVSGRRSPHVRFTCPSRTGAHPLKVMGLSKAYGSKQVLSDVSFEIERGEKVAIVGPNGIGKSTLLKIIMEKVKQDDGEFKWGHMVECSYFPQDIEEAVRGSESVIQWLGQRLRGLTETELRKTLARVLFGNDDIDKKLDALSGGERARLIMAQMMGEERNVLIFDEPTNHLDLESIEALTNSLKAYEGTVLFVSHNRWFVEKLATGMIEILKKEVRIIDGGYQRMLEISGEDHLNRDVSLRNRQEKKEEAKTPKAPIDREEEKKLRKQLSRLENDIAK